MEQTGKVKESDSTTTDVKKPNNTTKVLYSEVMTSDVKQTQNVAPPKQTQSLTNQTPLSTSKKAKSDFSNSLPPGKPAHKPSRPS